ncbi:hypothetical protein WICMUC_002762 [Wickerhamomyces mucosus]|uniref:SPT2 chromatin protein n=1 Tax=Wickerhamomyces mucosus TaxID=1378264 RepID=A0A9P8PNN5_9ASCO|nr:hypothetical protein WICMUC_002762 [Wickerhamomyces mucosus]
MTSSGSPSTSKATASFNKLSKSIDPAVQRLKELRRIEKEEKERRHQEALTAKKAANPPKPRGKRPSELKSNPSSIIRKRNVEHPISSPRISSSPVKRLTFTELMKEAQNKTKQLNEAKEQSPEPKSYVSKTQPAKKQLSTSSKSKLMNAPAEIKSSTSIYSKKVSSIQSFPKQSVQANAPKPLAQPSAKLKAKLDARKYKAQSSSSSVPDNRRSPNQNIPKRSLHEYSDEEDFSDDFIVDDDEQDMETDIGYDRNEIWKIMNRGRTKSHYNDYDDDLSDMEATGTDILLEEDRSSKRARQEDFEEQEREKIRIQEKKKRLGRK